MELWAPTRSCVLRFGAIMCTQMHNVSGGHLVISVIVPVYNVERWLDRCVTSIVGQTYKNLEIILIDDGSTDKSSEMCDAWSRLYNRIRPLLAMLDLASRQVRELRLWIAMTGLIPRCCPR